MKRIMGLLCVVLTLALLPVMAACSGGKDMSDSPYVGTWAATTASMSGISMDVETVYPGGLSFDLQSDGKVVVDIDGDTQTGSWDETGDGFIVEGEFTVVVSGTTGTMEYDGVTFEFAKEA